MTELASKGQLRMSFLRWALVTVPAIVGIGSVMGILSNSGYSNNWFVALDRPDIVPPGWVFGVVWTTLYTLIALAFAMILHARGAPGRIPAIAAFLIQLLLNFAWSPVFFGMRQVSLALLLIGAIWLMAVVTTFLFGRIRKAAAWLMVPYLVWLSFASILNYQIDVANPDAETLAVPVASTDIDVGQGE
jgi:benzodiazapine receptor